VALRQDDLIYALATGTGGAVAIIRLSGSSCWDTLVPLLKTKKMRGLRPRPRYFHYVGIYDGDSLLDDVCCVFFPLEKSYTGEEMAEIHCHGSRAIIQRICEILSQRGARPAKPGEFTRRAFINGRMGLSQAEAVRELIESDTIEEASVAIRKLQGELKHRVEELRHDLIDCAASLEATLDYPEEDIEHMDQGILIQRIDSLSSKISAMRHTYDRHKLAREGISVAILGKPNAGKSSLLNSLLKEERAIVTDIEGTTRDHIEESFQYKGIKFRLIDTAGIRESHDVVEKIGIERSLRFEKEADLVLYLYDGLIKVDLRSESQNAFHLLNKSDLGVHEDNRILLERVGVFSISAMRHSGLEKLLNAMQSFGRNLITQTDSEVPVITSERHAHCLDSAYFCLNSFKDSLIRGIPMDIALVELYEARDHLGQITGMVATADIIDRIFEKFCIGK